MSPIGFGTYANAINTLVMANPRVVGDKILVDPEDSAILADAYQYDVWMSEQARFVVTCKASGRPRSSFPSDKVPVDHRETRGIQLTLAKAGALAQHERNCPQC